jgi:putative ABC transport system permease protein
MYALKTLTEQLFRFIITVLGVALCVILVLFLLGIYRGVSTGSVEYVRSSNADLWVLQRHATNILRCTSILTPDHAAVIRECPGVSEISPVLFILASVRLPEGPATLYLTGYNPAGGGGPPAIEDGRNIAKSGEVVLDRSFAAKHHIRIGDRLPVKNDTLAVVGLSKGTNMFVIQYAFITLADAHRIIGVPGIVTCFQVRTAPGAGIRSTAEGITTALPDVSVFERDEFLRNNIREMESGILPLLFVVAVIGSVVLMAILSLILSINVLERRKDFAIMKALGSPSGYLPALVIIQSLILSAGGLFAGILLFFPLMQAVERFSPEVSVLTSAGQIMAVVSGVTLISLVSSILPNRKLRSVYPLEVFK